MFKPLSQDREHKVGIDDADHDGGEDDSGGCSRNKFQGRCYVCGEKGHSAKFCPDLDFCGDKAKSIKIAGSGG